MITGHGNIPFVRFVAGTVDMRSHCQSQTGTPYPTAGTVEVVVQ